MAMFKINVRHVSEWTFNVYEDDEDSAKEVALDLAQEESGFPHKSSRFAATVEIAPRAPMGLGDTARPGECPTEHCDCE